MNTKTAVFNCIQIAIMKENIIYVEIIAGEDCISRARSWLQQQYVGGRPAVVWDKNMESLVYPLCYDLQVAPQHACIGAKQSLGKVF